MIRANKQLILPSIINKIVQVQIEALPRCGDREKVLKINKIKARMFAEEGGVDHNGTETMFGQIM